ncbi:283_t:CDS:2 [Entrophospora sp. SA101]|nr:283_t:CDS:2 [Entrophospora sp. SA101]
MTIVLKTIFGSLDEDELTEDIIKIFSTSNVQMSVIPTISEETGNFPFLQKFLKEAPLEEITISRILHETWRLYGFQTNNDDCARIVNILAEIRYLWNELKSLVDANLFRSKFYESETWKLQAERNIGSLKDAMRKGNTAVHGQILREIDKLDLNNLTYDDPICNGVVDLKCDRFLINEVDFDILVNGVIVNLQNLRNSSKKKCKAVDPNDSPLHEVTIRIALRHKIDCFDSGKYYAEGDTSDSEPESQISTPQSKNNDLSKKAHSVHYNPFDSQIAEIDSMLTGMLDYQYWR